jgi:LPS O-antigen subunit length determinant protein (WzzB/FepE family)
LSETKNEVKTDSKPAATDADLMRQIEMLKAQVDTREKQLRQAIDIANRANDERKARDEAEKSKLIDSIMMDSKFGKDDLKDKSLADLQTMRITLDKSIEKTFASVAAEMDENRRTKQPLLTVGAWDAASKTWKGGL